MIEINLRLCGGDRGRWRAWGIPFWNVGALQSERVKLGDGRAEGAHQGPIRKALPNRLRRRRRRRNIRCAACHRAREGRAPLLYRATHKAQSGPRKPGAQRASPDPRKPQPPSRRRRAARLSQPRRGASRCASPPSDTPSSRPALRQPRPFRHPIGR